MIITYWVWNFEDRIERELGLKRTVADLSVLGRRFTKEEGMYPTIISFYHDKHDVYGLCDFLVIERHYSKGFAKLESIDILLCNELKDKLVPSVFETSHIKIPIKKGFRKELNLVVKKLIQNSKK